MSLILLLGLALAAPGGFREALAAAEAAIARGDAAAAAAALDAAEAAAPTHGALLPAAEIGRIPFLRGAAAWRAGALDEALGHWRRTLAQVPTFTPDPAVLPDPEAQDAFYALVDEVRAFPEVATGLPGDLGGTLYFIDGRRLTAEDFVFEGRHFVQARCPDGRVVGDWHDFGRAPPYPALCTDGRFPGGAVAAAAAEAAAVAEAATRRAAEQEAAARADAERAAEQEAAAKQAAEAAARAEPPEPAPPEPAPPEPAEPVEAAGPVERDRGGSRRVAAWSLLGGGTALLGGGAAVSFLVVDPAFDAIADANAAPGSVTRAEADRLESRFGQGRAAALLLLGGGVAALGTGVVLGPIDAVWVAPGGVGLAGRW